MSAVTVLLVEDHRLIREALRALLQESGAFMIVGQAEDGARALTLVEKLHPHIVVMDIMMPNLNGLEATVRIRAMPSAPQVVILSQHHSTEYVVQALLSGAKAYLLKDAAVDELVTALQTVMQGETYLSNGLDRDAIEQLLSDRTGSYDPLQHLTQREREVLQLVVEGNTNRQIALKLGISIKTVEKHRFSVMEKLNIRDVTGLVRFAITRGIISGQRE